MGVPGLVPSARRWAAALALFLVSAGACLVFLRCAPIPVPHDDAVEYLSIARNISDGNGFSQDGTTPGVFRPPLFSGMLGGWFAVTGTRSVPSAAVFQSLLHSLGVVAAFFLFLELSPPAWAFGGALLLSLHPMLVTRVAFVLQEPALALFTTVSMLASVRYLKGRSKNAAALAGSAWGVCTLGKSVSWFGPLLLAAASFHRNGSPGSRRGREAALLFLCFAAVIAPWTARNYARFGRFIPVNGQGPGVLEWNIAHTPVAGEVDGIRFLSELDRKGVAGEERRRIIRKRILDHPREFLLVRTVRNAIHFAAPPRDWWISRGLVLPDGHGPLFWGFALVFHVPLYGALLYATGKVFRGIASPGLRFAVLFYWLYWAEHAIVWGDPRYGLAVYPVLLSIALSVAASACGGGVRQADGPG